jgi:hypothetical protein
LEDYNCWRNKDYINAQPEQPLHSKDWANPGYQHAKTDDYND